MRPLRRHGGAHAHSAMTPPSAIPASGYWMPYCSASVTPIRQAYPPMRCEFAKAEDDATYQPVNQRIGGGEETVDGGLRHGGQELLEPVGKQRWEQSPDPRRARVRRDPPERTRARQGRTASETGTTCRSACRSRRDARQVQPCAERPSAREDALHEPVPGRSSGGVTR